MKRILQQIGRTLKTRFSPSGTDENEFVSSNRAFIVKVYETHAPYLKDSQFGVPIEDYVKLLKKTFDNKTVYIVLRWNNYVGIQQLTDGWTEVKRVMQGRRPRIEVWLQVKDFNRLAVGD